MERICSWIDAKVPPYPSDVVTDPSPAGPDESSRVAVANPPQRDLPAVTLLGFHIRSLAVDSGHVRKIME
jgi:hypothetical protein